MFILNYMVCIRTSWCKFIYMKMGDGECVQKYWPKCLISIFCLRDTG